MTDQRRIVVGFQSEQGVYEVSVSTSCVEITQKQGQEGVHGQESSLVVPCDDIRCLVGLILETVELSEGVEKRLGHDC